MICISGNAVDNWDDNGIKVSRYPLFVISSGYQKFITRNFKITRPKGRVDYQFIYLIQGKGYFNFGNGYQEIGEGNLIVYQPSQPQLYDYFAENSTVLYWIHFSGSKAAEWLEKLNLSDKFVFHVGIIGDCIEIFKKIIDELRTKDYLFEYNAGANLMEMMLIFARNLKINDLSNSKTMDAMIESITAYMHENYNQRISVSELANMCNLSLYRFIHKFKEVNGMPPMQYLTMIRIKEAKHLLSHSHFNISEISSLVGYNDPLYFSRVFKKVTGVSPKIYKQNI